MKLNTNHAFFKDNYFLINNLNTSSVSLLWDKCFLGMKNHVFCKEIKNISKRTNKKFRKKNKYDQWIPEVVISKSLHARTKHPGHLNQNTGWDTGGGGLLHSSSSRLEAVSVHASQQLVTISECSWMRENSSVVPSYRFRGRSWGSLMSFRP